MSRNLATVIAVLCAVLTVTGCGSDDKPRSDRDQVREVVERFNDAFSGGDYGDACDLMHSHRRQQLEDGRGLACEEILADAAGIEARLVEALADVRITSISIQQDVANVSVEGPSVGASQAMVERDGDRGWRLSESAAGL